MPSILPVIPPLDDHLIPEVIDFNLKHNAVQPFFTFSDPALPNQVQVITHLEFGRAVHRLAHALRPNRSGNDGEVVAIIALSDTIVYQAIVAGCIVAGLVPFPISPRSSPAAVVNLLQKTSCRRLMTTNVTLKPLIDGIRDQIATTPLSNIQIEEVPSLATAYPNLGHESFEHAFERYPHPAQRPSKYDTCIYLHSSGSTGLPKAIAQTHLAWMQWVAFPSVVDFQGLSPNPIIACMALPPFHTLGLYLQLLNPIYGIVAISLYPPTATAPNLLPVVPSPQNILEHTKITRSTMLIVIPTLLQVWSQSTDEIEFLTTLSYVGYSGGSLAPRLGNRLVNSGVHLHPVYGGTEFGAPTHPILLEGKENWEYVRFHERAKVRWAPQGDGTFECQFLSWKYHQPMILNLPDVEGYSTSDLFVPHPTKEGLWKIVGRIDDVVVHSSGEKTVPAPMEDVILSSPIVHGVLIFGRDHDRAGVLIEPKPQHAIAIDTEDHAELSALRNKLWPVVEEANRIAPAFSKIYKEMIIITSNNKPLPRTGKGTVMRKAALALYGDEISTLYDIVESNIKTSQTVAPPTSWTLPDIQDWIVDQVQDLLSRADVSISVDLFEQGFDSLSATFLRLRIIGALQASRSQSAMKAIQALDQNLVYSYPMVPALATHIVSLLESREKQPDSHTHDRVLIEDLVEKYSFGLGTPSSQRASPRSVPAIVLLTGSTGNIGSEILAALLKDSRVDHVYAYNRPCQASDTILERHVKIFKERGLEMDLLASSKVSFISGEAAQPNLDLDHDQYNHLSRSVNVIIHNAWKVDFNMSLSSFEPNIRATRHLVDLVKSGPSPEDTRFLFISSISSAQSWPCSKGPYPEEIVMDSSSAVGGGYGEAKYVAERILAKSGIQATSLRIGQVCGGRPNGVWPVTDWFPILVKSSTTMGVLPNIKGVVSWIPTDIAVSALVEATLRDEALPEALNLVHPRPTEATDIIKALQASILKTFGLDLEIVPFSEWLAILDKHAMGATAQVVAELPAIKLLDFFRKLSQGKDEIYSQTSTKGQEAGGLPSFLYDKMLQTSPEAMIEARSVGAEEVALWVNYWQKRYM